MHVWGDDWFEKYGQELYEAIHFVTYNSRKYGRLSMGGKEKYGTFRDEFLGPWDGTLNNLCYPAYHYIQLNRWFYCNIDYPIISKINKYTGIRFLFWQYQKLVYNIIIQTACKRYPNIVDELVQDSSLPYAIRPGIFGKIDGQTIHDKYWTRGE